MTSDKFDERSSALLYTCLKAIGEWAECNGRLSISNRIALNALIKGTYTVLPNIDAYKAQMGIWEITKQDLEKMFPYYYEAPARIHTGNKVVWDIWQHYWQRFSQEVVPIFLAEHSILKHFKVDVI